MYKNVMLMKNGCEGCSMDICLGVRLAESLDAKVTALYVQGNFSWKELRNIYGIDELKWPGAGRSCKHAIAAVEGQQTEIACEVLDATEKMCSGLGIRCEKVLFSCKSPLQGALKMAAEKKCDVIVTSIPSDGFTKPLIDIQQFKTDGNGRSKIPVLFHHAV